MATLKLPELLEKRQHLKKAKCDSPSVDSVGYAKVFTADGTTVVTSPTADHDIDDDVPGHSYDSVPNEKQTLGQIPPQESQVSIDSAYELDLPQLPANPGQLSATQPVTTKLYHNIGLVTVSPKPVVKRQPPVTIEEGTLEQSVDESSQAVLLNLKQNAKHYCEPIQAKSQYTPIKKEMENFSSTYDIPAYMGMDMCCTRKCYCWTLVVSVIVLLILTVSVAFAVSVTGWTRFSSEISELSLDNLRDGWVSLSLQEELSHSTNMSAIGQQRVEYNVTQKLVNSIGGGIDEVRRILVYVVVSVLDVCEGAPGNQQFNSIRLSVKQGDGVSHEQYIAVPTSSRHIYRGLAISDNLWFPYSSDGVLCADIPAQCNVSVTMYLIGYC